MDNTPKEQPQQQTPQPTTPHAPPPALKPLTIQQKPSHTTAILLLVVGALAVSGMITYILISPSRKTLVAPATIENPLKPLVPTIAKTKTTTALPSPTLTPIPTLPSTSWKTYTNSLYGYSIKYPPDWTAKDLGALEPKIPSYIVFNPTTASASARSITISVSIRTYAEQLALAASGSATTVGGITGTKQSFQDSDGNTSTVVTLPRTNTLLVLRAKTKHLTVFNQMLTTLQTSK